MGGWGEVHANKETVSGGDGRGGGRTANVPLTCRGRAVRGVEGRGGRTLRAGGQEKCWGRAADRWI